MPRSGPNGTYTLPGAQATQQPGTPIPSAVNNQGYSDIEQTFNTVQPRAYGGTDSSDLKLNDANFGVRNNADATKIGAFNAAGLPTATTRTYDLPYYSGTLGLVSDIRGYRYQLTMTNNAIDVANDIDVSSGSAVDSTGVFSILLASAITKRVDASWAVGTNQGGLDTGVVSNTRYYIFLIRRPDTGVVDVLFSLSATTPTLPANYTQFALIGNINRLSGSNTAPTLPNEAVWFPTTTQGGAVSTSSSVGIFQKNGSIVTISGQVVYSGAGTAANPIVVSNLPFPMSAAVGQSIGSAYLFDNGSQFYVLAGYVASSTSIRFIAQGGTADFGVSPAVTLAALDRLTFIFTYAAN